MERSRDPAVSSAAASTTHPMATPAFTSLAEQYGLADMQFGSVEDGKGQTLDEEYRAYVNGALSKQGTDTLKFWEVRNFYH